MRKKIIIAVSIVLSFFVGASGMYLLIRYLPIDTATVIKDTRNFNIKESDSISASIAKIYDAVVVVETSNGNQIVGSGTGFIYKTDDKYAYVLTNNHVVSGGNNVIVTFQSDKTSEATVLGSDSYADLAVLRISKENVTNVAIIGKSSEAEIGDTVFTIGAPLGSEYSGTVTKGIISGKDRMVSVNVDSQSGTSDYIMNVIQTDAAINPGNSGGPLVNINGEVIGINSLKLVEEEVEGIGFAIPIDDAMTYVEYLEKGEAIKRPMLGVSLIDKSETFGLYSYGIIIDRNSPDGVVVASVEENSPAAKAGLQKGDIITKMDDKEVTSRAQLRYNLYKYSIGDKIKVTYYRNGEEKTVEVTLDQELQ